jgi:glycosyltransferase involved in cell wall biosynthesis
LPENLEQYAQELKKILGIGNKNVILYLGRLIPRKGVHYLIRALKYIDIKEYVLLIVGDGECRDELKKQVEELGMGEYVIFTGKIPHEKLAIYYQISDVVVLPSITHGIGDPWVMVLNEAMFLKKPVIATNAVGAAPDMIINGKNGYIIPERDVESLSKSLNMILKNQDLAMEMGLESYKIVTGHFQYVNMADGFKNAVEYSLKKG